MALKRIVYLLILLCGGVFYVLSPGYLSFFLLVALIALPFLSLLLTLPALFRLRLTAAPAVHAVPRGGSVTLRFALLPGTGGYGLRLRWRFDNLLYPQLREGGGADLLRENGVEIPVPTDHCGWVRCTVTRCSVRDWLGLWSLPVKAPQPVLVLVRPVEDPSGLPDLDEPAAGRRLVPRPGGGMGEEYDLRDYRPGDPVNEIHWKLTAKRPADKDPILRETLEPARALLAVSYDHFGRPDEVDRALDRTAALAARLLERARPFVLLWQAPDGAGDVVYDITCPADWERCLRDISAKAAPETGVSRPPAAIPGHAGPARYLRLDGADEEGGR